MKKLLQSFLHSLVGEFFILLLLTSVVLTIYLCYKLLPINHEYNTSRVSASKKVTEIKYCETPFAVKRITVEGVDVLESINAYVHHNYWFCKALGLGSPTQQIWYKNSTDKRIDIVVKKFDNEKYQITLKPRAHNKYTGNTLEIIIDTGANTFSIEHGALIGVYKRNDYTFWGNLNGSSVGDRPPLSGTVITTETKIPLELYKEWGYYYKNPALHVRFSSKSLLYEMIGNEYHSMIDPYDSSAYANRSCSDTTIEHCIAFQIGTIWMLEEDKLDFMPQLTKRAANIIDGGEFTFYKQVGGEGNFPISYFAVHKYLNVMYLITTNEHSEYDIEDQILPSFALDSYTDTSYNELSQSKKEIIDRFVEKYNEPYQSFLRSYNGDVIQVKSLYKIKYLDKDTVAIAVPSEKIGIFFDIYDTKTLEKVSAIPFTFMGGQIETKNYIVDIDYQGIIYYKKGSLDFFHVPNSSLSDPETYAETSGMGGDDTDFSFDETTKTVTVSVFKRESRTAENPRVRVVKFILE